MDAEATPKNTKEAYELNVSNPNQYVVKRSTMQALCYRFSDENEKNANSLLRWIMDKENRCFTKRTNFLGCDDDDDVVFFTYPRSTRNISSVPRSHHSSDPASISLLSVIAIHYLDKISFPVMEASREAG